MDKISSILKSRRQELKLKAKDVAKRIGVAESTYREWENGRNIQGEPYLKIAEILEIPLTKLMGVKKIPHDEIYNELENINQSIKNIQKYVSQIL